jgi:hypothetical protein
LYGLCDSVQMFVLFVWMSWPLSLAVLFVIKSRDVKVLAICSMVVVGRFLRFLAWVWSL